MYEIYAKIRDEKGLTDYKVAKAIGATTGSMSQWKTGRCEPKFDRLVAIADFLGVPVDIFANASRERTKQ